MKISDLNNAKVPIVKIDKSLERFRGKVLFPEKLELANKLLANIVGLKSRASEILNRKRKLSLEMIRQLHERLHIPTDVLIQTY